MRTKKGVVVSAKMNKTVVIAVDRYVEHPLYKKSYKKTTKFHAHDEENSCVEGDVITVFEVAPISKKKRWSVLKEGEVKS